MCLVLLQSTRICACISFLLLYVFVAEIFTELQSTLERMRAEEFTWDEDINFLQDTFRDPDFLALCDVNDGVANSQSFDQPIAGTKEILAEVLYNTHRRVLYRGGNPKISPLTYAP